MYRIFSGHAVTLLNRTHARARDKTLHINSPYKKHRSTK